FAAAPEHLGQSRHAVPGQIDGDLIARADIQLPPAPQRAKADPAQLASVQLQRIELQNRRDATAAADVELHVAHPGERLVWRIFPGGGPARWCCDPALPIGPTTLAQNHPVSGEGQDLAIPAVAPVSRFRRAGYRLG